MALSLIDHVELGISRLISQYKDQPRIEALLTSYLNRIQNIEEAILDVYSGVINLDEAVGDNLDIVGSILDEPRAGQPDFIYRRRLQAKVYVIRSQGTVQDFITIIRKFEGLYQSDGETPDSSEIYVVLSEAWDGTNQTGEGKGTEISIFPESTNEWEDPNPFDPKGMHDQLLKAKGAGEPLQTIYPIVNVTKNPKTDGLRLIHSASGGLPPTSAAGFGSLYVTGSDGLSLFGGTLGHRRSGISNFADSGVHAVQTAPSLSLDSAYAIGTSITVTPGIWSGLPDSRLYTLFRSSSAGIVADTTWVTKSLSDINDYTLNYEDVGADIFVREYAYRAGIPVSADTNEVYSDITDFDSNIVVYWRFNDVDGIISSSGGSDGTRIRTVSNIISPNNNGNYVLTGTFYNNSPYLVSYTASNALGWGAAGFAGPDATHFRFMEDTTTGLSGLSNPLSVFTLAMPTGAFGTGSYKPHILNNYSGPRTPYYGRIFTSQSLWWTQEDFPGFTNLVSRISGGSAVADTPSAILYYNRASVDVSGAQWVNDFRTTSAITGVLDQGTWGPSVVVGWDNTNLSSAFQGLVWEIAVRTGSLSENDRKLWANYYTNKFGVTVLSD